MSELNQKTAEASAADVELFDFYVAQLEAYLDGELSAEEAAQVRRRLMQEEAYAAALGRLHAQRVQRLEVFRNVERQEIADDSAARVAASARRLAVAAPASHGWPTWAKLVIGMAACVLVGFGGGLIGDYSLGTEPPPANPTRYAVDDESGQGLTGWVRFENGRPVVELPAEEEPFQDLMYIPDRTLPQPPH